MLSAIELTTLTYLRMTGETAEYTAHVGDRYILWKNLQELKKSLDVMNTVANSSGTPQEIQLAFRDYIQRLTLQQIDGITVATGIVNMVKYKTTKHTITPIYTRTVGRSWYPKLVIYMQLFDTMRTHQQYGNYIAWSTYVMEI